MFGWTTRQLLMIERNRISLMPMGRKEIPRVILLKSVAWKNAIAHGNGPACDTTYIWWFFWTRGNCTSALPKSVASTSQLENHLRSYGSVGRLHESGNCRTTWRNWRLGALQADPAQAGHTLWGPKLAHVTVVQSRATKDKIITYFWYCTHMNHILSSCCYVHATTRNIARVLLFWDQIADLFLVKSGSLPNYWT